MFIDNRGIKRLKVGLHIHTTRTDGVKTPEEAILEYKEAGYDIIALTDHHTYGAPIETEGIQVISGGEYGCDCFSNELGVMEVFHILGIDMKENPMLPTKGLDVEGADIYEKVRNIVKKIRQTGGVAILAHPAWSLNAADQIIKAGDFDGLEIYNSVSGYNQSDRPYSGGIVDALAMRGICYPLLATDDTHFYTGEQNRGMIMVEADAVEEMGIAGAIRERRFYATQGPEIYLERISEEKLKLFCSPVVKISFFSNLQWRPERIVYGENLTEFIYTVDRKHFERFVRAEVTDAEGRMAWSNIIWID